MNSENKSLLIFKSLKQDIDLNAKLEKNHDFYFFISGEIKEFFLLHYFRELTDRSLIQQREVGILLGEVPNWD
jgi:hypothetical protein